MSHSTCCCCLSHLRNVYRIRGGGGGEQLLILRSNSFVSHSILRWSRFPVPWIQKKYMRGKKKEQKKTFKPKIHLILLILGYRNCRPRLIPSFEWSPVVFVWQCPFWATGGFCSPQGAVPAGHRTADQFFSLGAGFFWPFICCCFSVIQ